MRSMRTEESVGIQPISPSDRNARLHRLRTKKRHVVSISADIIESFRKMRREKAMDVMTQIEENKFVVESKLEKMMVDSGVIPGGDTDDMQSNGLNSSLEKQRKKKGRVGEKKRVAATVFEKKKVDLVHGRLFFEHPSEENVELKSLYCAYGQVNSNNQISEEEDISSQSDDQPTDDSVDPEKQETPCEAGTFSNPLEPMHAKYARAIQNVYERTSNIIFERKRKRIVQERETRKKRAVLRDSVIGENPLYLHDSYTKDGRVPGHVISKIENNRLRNIRELEEKAKREAVLDASRILDNNETAAEKGERRLLDFIKRFHGGFKYQNNQLYFEGFQLLFINEVIPTLAPNIVGDSWGAVGPRLMKQFGWGRDNMHEVLVAQAPRRFGKTICIAVTVINYALAKSGCEIAIFSTCKRVSGFLQEKILKILKQSGYGDWDVGHGQEYIYLKDPNDPNDQIRKICSYPASSVISIFFDYLFIFIILSLEKKENIFNITGFLYTSPLSHSSGSPFLAYFINQWFFRKISQEFFEKTIEPNVSVSSSKKIFLGGDRCEHNLNKQIYICFPSKKRDVPYYKEECFQLCSGSTPLYDARHFFFLRNNLNKKP